MGGRLETEGKVGVAKTRESLDSPRETNRRRQTVRNRGYAFPGNVIIRGMSGGGGELFGSRAILRLDQLRYVLFVLTTAV